MGRHRFCSTGGGGLNHATRFCIGGLVAAALACAGCGGGGYSAPAPSPTPSPTPASVMVNILGDRGGQSFNSEPRLSGCPADGGVEEHRWCRAPDRRERQLVRHGQHRRKRHEHGDHRSERGDELPLLDPPGHDRARSTGRRAPRPRARGLTAGSSRRARRADDGVARRSRLRPPPLPRLPAPPSRRR